MAQQEVDAAQGKDLEPTRTSLPPRMRYRLPIKDYWPRRPPSKRPGHVGYANITAPFTGVVTEIDAYTGALLPAGTSSNKGDQALCRLSQNNICAW